MLPAAPFHIMLVIEYLARELLGSVGEIVGNRGGLYFFFLASNHLVQIIVSLVIFSVEPNVHINVILPTVDIALFQCGLIEKTIHCTSLQDTLSHLVRSNIAVLTIPENSLVISARHNTVIYTLLFLILE